MFRSVSLPRSGSASKIGTPAPDPVKLIYNMQSSYRQQGEMFNSVYVSVLKGTVHPKIKSPSSSVVEENAAVFCFFLS